MNEGEIRGSLDKFNPDKVINYVDVLLGGLLKKAQGMPYEVRRVLEQEAPEFKTLCHDDRDCIISAMLDVNNAYREIAGTQSAGQPPFITADKLKKRIAEIKDPLREPSPAPEVMH